MKRFFPLFAIISIFSSCLNNHSHSGKYNITFTITPAKLGIEKLSADATSNIFHRRLLLYGLEEKQIAITGHGAIITIELTGADDTLRLENLVASQGQLEFRETYPNPEFYNTLSNINAALVQKHASTEKDNEGVNPLEGGIPDPSLIDSIPPADERHVDPRNSKDSNPLFNKLNAAIEFTDGKYQLRMGPVIGYCLSKDTAEVMQMLTSDSTKPLIPLHVRFRWSMTPNRPSDLYSLFALNFDSAGTPFMSGKIVRQASFHYDADGKPQISIEFNDEGRKRFYLMTRRNIGKSIAITVDGKVVSSPKVIAEIKEGRAVLSGGSENEFRDLCAILQADYFPHKTKMQVH